MLTILLESSFSLTISVAVFRESVDVFSLAEFSVFKMVDSALFSEVAVCSFIEFGELFSVLVEFLIEF